jgi:hypothetical protein
MSGGSAVKAAVGRGGSPVLAATIGSEKRGNAPRRPQGLAFTARGPQAPRLKTETDQPKAGRIILREGSFPDGRDAERLGKHCPTVRVEPGPALAVPEPISCFYLILEIKVGD